MTASSPTRPTSHPKNVFRLHGVNVLNRKNVDSIARLTAIERRRTTHILDERQRRDTMNQLLNELAGLIQESTGEAPVLDQQATSEPTQNEGNQGVVDSNSAPPPEEERKRPPVKRASEQKPRSLRQRHPLARLLRADTCLTLLTCMELFKVSSSIKVSGSE
ncbi:hypothetical protein BGW38_003311 [Lunasporangiospora selenospora]|uniref:BHLH domain-containing protein n=1 Tax=Lunasporangiospora selenospora TaxID=979761 RepID=A0A9P6FS06_9FUNG|nr:hypothetical protein BGW38_003311 [Lunasporangiospora selenospora]